MDSPAGGPVTLTHGGSKDTRGDGLGGGGGNGGGGGSNGGGGGALSD